jgi:hypothetical protein
VTLAVRRHDIALGSDGSLEYTKTLAAVGDVGDSGQFKAGHELADASFPSAYTGSFYNLEDTSDGSGNVRSLVNNGSIAFTGNSILGASDAATLNGTSQYLSTTNVYFNPGDSSDFTCGGWFYSSDWSPASAMILFGQWPTVTNKSFALRVNTDGTLSLFTSTDGTTDVNNAISIEELDAGYHHFAVKYVAADNEFHVYVDEILAETVALGAALNQNSSPDFTIGSWLGGSTYFSGVADEFFFDRSAYSDNQISKVYAARIDHDRTVSPQDQKWFSWSSSDAIMGNEHNYIADIDTNSLYCIFSDLDSTVQVELKMYNGSPVGDSKPSKSKRLEMTASALDALLPLSHGLGTVPELTFKVKNASNKFEGHYWGNYFTVTSTQIELAGSSLTTLLGASTVVQLTYSTSTVSQFVPNRFWNSYSVSSDSPVAANDTAFVDTSGGAVELTLPASPSIGDEIRFIDHTGNWGTNNLTVNRNGKNIDGSAANYVADVDNSNFSLIYNGNNDWRAL